MSKDGKQKGDTPWPVMGRVRVHVEGLSLEKLMSRAAAQGIRLSKVVRTDTRGMSITLRAGEYPAFCALAQSVGWRVTVCRQSMLSRSQGLMAKRMMLAAGILVFCTVVWIAHAFVWFVRIEGAGEFLGEVRTVLAAQDVRPGRFRETLDLEAVRAALEQRLPQVAWVNVRLQGVTVSVTCVPARVPLEAEYGGEACDVIAARDGVVRAMTVYAGTPLVKVGDAVRRGQVLVSGQERSADGAMRAVPARAEVLSRVWYSARARIPAMQSDATPTGKEQGRIVYCTPWGSWSQDPPSTFAEEDIAMERQAIGGVFVPLWIQYEHYAEVTMTRSLRDRQQLEQESSTIAERLAREKLPFGAQILDKWVEYSMMKDEHFAAEVVLETVENIATIATSHE